MKIFNHISRQGAVATINAIKNPQEKQVLEDDPLLVEGYMGGKIPSDSIYYSVRLPVVVTEEELEGLIKRIHSGEESPTQPKASSPSSSVFASGSEYDEDRAIENARKLLKIYQVRAEIIGGLEFADPAWLILLDLFTHGDKAASVSTACAASGVASTTALRYVTRLADAGLITRSPHPFDLRAIELKLTPKARQSLIKILS